jgi:hypothetical protein
MGFKRALPSKKLFLRELVAAAGFLNSDHIGAHCRDDRCFAAHHPSLGGRRRKFSILEIHCASSASCRLAVWAGIAGDVLANLLVYRLDKCGVLLR